LQALRIEKRFEGGEANEKNLKEAVKEIGQWEQMVLYFYLTMRKEFRLMGRNSRVFALFPC
jgi:hypothetical protein